MATQYTSTLKLALPVQGELTGSWGNTINDEITSMVEEAIAGLAVIDTWAANSHTLTVVSGATSESRCAILRLTDTGVSLSGAGTLICPPQGKLYLVENNTGQAITVKTSGGTGISIPNTETGLVFCDAVNVLSGVTSNVTTNLSKTATTTDVTINSSDGDNVAIGAASTSVAGVMTKAVFDEHELNNAKETNVVQTSVTGNAGTVTDGFYTTSNLAGDVTGTPDATVVGDDSHTHTSATITGLSGTNTGDGATNSQYSGLLTWATAETTNFTGASNASKQIDASSNTVDVTLPVLVAGDSFSYHNKAASTFKVQILNPTQTIKGSTGDIAAGTNMEIAAGQSVQMIADSTTVLSIVWVLL